MHCFQHSKNQDRKSNWCTKKLRFIINKTRQELDNNKAQGTKENNNNKIYFKYKNRDAKRIGTWELSSQKIPRSTITEQFFLNFSTVDQNLFYCGSKFFNVVLNASSEELSNFGRPFEKTITHLSTP